MSKRAWTLIAVVAVLGVLIGAYFWLTRPKPAPAAGKAAQLELAKGDKDTITKIVLTDRKEGTLTFTKKNGTWLTEPASVAKVDPSNMSDLLYTFSALNAERVIDPTPTDLAAFGLAPAQARGIVTWENGTSVEVLLGNRTDANNTYYLQVKGNPKVYTVWANTGELLHWTMNNVRSKAFTPTINYDEITYLKLVERNGTVIEVRRKSPDEGKNYQLGFGGFVLTRPYAALRGLDANKQDSVIKGPEGVSIADFVEDTPRDLSKYGLSRPWGEAIVRDKSNTIDFLFGSATADGKTYFMVKGQPSVMTVETSNLSFMSAQPFDLADKFAFIPNIDDVDRIDITAAGASHVLTIARSAKKAEKAGDPDEVVAAYAANGKSVEEKSFKAFYQDLIGLIVEGEVTHRVRDTPEISVKYALNKGPKKTVRIDFVPYDRDFDAVFVDGVNEFALTKGQLKEMLAGLDALLKGKPVSE
jgi:hypothetical protein